MNRADFGRLRFEGGMSADELALDLLVFRELVRADKAPELGELDAAARIKAPPRLDLLPAPKLLGRTGHGVLSGWFGEG